MPVIERAEILRLIPHAGPMCLIDEVICWSEDDIVCAAHGHRSAEHPLRRAGTLSALHLIEYGAQAMAIHGALLARRDGAAARPGMLVAVRDFHASAPTLDDLDQPLRIEARAQLSRADALIYSFRVMHSTSAIATGRVTVMLSAYAPDGTRTTPRNATSP